MKNYRLNLMLVKVLTYYELSITNYIRFICLLISDFITSLADAKMLKDILKHHIIRNLTSDVRNKEDTLSYVL